MNEVYEVAGLILFSISMYALVYFVVFGKNPLDLLN